MLPHRNATASKRRGTQPWTQPRTGTGTAAHVWSDEHSLSSWGGRGRGGVEAGGKNQPSRVPPRAKGVNRMGQRGQGQGQGAGLAGHADGPNHRFASQPRPFLPQPNARHWRNCAAAIRAHWPTYQRPPKQLPGPRTLPLPTHLPKHPYTLSWLSLQRRNGCPRHAALAMEQSSKELVNIGIIGDGPEMSMMV